MANYNYAHSGRGPDRADWQPLHDHLAGVAQLARRFAREARREAEGLHS